MHSLSEHEVLIALIALAVILTLARAMAELARRIGQPEVLGELCAGFLLGPSVFGALLPSLHHAIFLNPSVSFVLSGMSWIGVMLLLLLAGIEVDLAILRQVAKPGILAAALAIIPSLIAGSLFASLVLGKTPPGGFFLGIVLSVTGVSVAAKILMERQQMRRRYAQVIVAAGVASEIVVWLFVAVVSAFHSSSPLLAGLIHAAYAIAFFAVMMTVGRRFTFWAMRRVRDVVQISHGRLTFVLALTFAAGAVTHALGLHALLGAFVVGVLLSQAPRTHEGLLEDLQTFTVSFFGPIFFVLAGMRVDVLKLGSLSAIATVLLLLIVAAGVKIGLATVGARLGGLGGWESGLVGLGVNMKGGTDVVVAVIGTELGLLSTRAYTMYAVVAILTVFFSPMLLSILEAKAPPKKEEQDRLESEEAERRSYVPKVERVLVPISKALLGSLAASVVEEIAASKHRRGQIFDITQLEVQRGSQTRQSSRAQEARRRLTGAGTLKTVELTERTVQEGSVVDNIVKASGEYDLIAIGARPPKEGGMLSLGEMADAIVDRASADVLVAIDHRAEHFDCSSARRILVPTNGLGPSMAAGDIAGALADGCHSELILLHVVQSAEGEQEQMVESAAGHLDDLVFRIGRLGVPVEKRVVVAGDAGQAILAELRDSHYDLLVLGGVDRGHDGRVYLGHTLQTVLTANTTPAILLVTHEHA